MTRHLAGIVDLPYVTPTGRLVTRVGYDPETKLYLDVPMALTAGSLFCPNTKQCGIIWLL